jgi:histidine ammonia-lyase
VLLLSADLACAMSVEALRGTDAVYDEAAVAIRPHPGALDAAANLRALPAGSPITV